MTYKLTHNELEQYGRHTSLRINNMIFRGPRDPPQDERTLTLSVLDFLNSDVLKGEHILVERDIEQCHFVGKPRTSRSQQTFVKFARYHDNWKVYSSSVLF